MTDEQTNLLDALERLRTGNLCVEDNAGDIAAAARSTIVLAINLVDRKDKEIQRLRSELMLQKETTEDYRRGNDSAKAYRKVVRIMTEEMLKCRD